MLQTRNRLRCYGIVMRANKIIQIALLVFGCLPTIGLYVVLSLGVLFFALPATFIGNPLNALFVLWWLLGSFGLFALVHSFATYGSALPLRGWQRVGLITGAVVTFPLVGFVQGPGILGLFGVAAAILILVTKRKSNESTVA
jgi:hypothetical protein